MLVVVAGPAQRCAGDVVDGLGGGVGAELDEVLHDGCRHTMTVSPMFDSCSSHTRYQRYPPTMTSAAIAMATPANHRTIRLDSSLTLVITGVSALRVCV
jgi:hypothetical protein